MQRIVFRANLENVVDTGFVDQPQCDIWESKVLFTQQQVFARQNQRAWRDFAWTTLPSLEEQLVMYNIGHGAFNLARLVKQLAVAVVNASLAPGKEKQSHQ